MGAAVTLAAGEIIGDGLPVDYGRARLHHFREHTDYHGSFNEYNSPTYTLVALHELERILDPVRDPQARDDAQALRRITWEVIADCASTCREGAARLSVWTRTVMRLVPVASRRSFTWAQVGSTGGR